MTRSPAALPVLATLLVAAFHARFVEAQTPAPPDPAPSVITVTAGYEVHRDRFSYTFENPSSIDTPFLVPHSFTQTYVADNQWLVVGARVPVATTHVEGE